MDFKVIAGIIAAVLPFIAYAPYLRDTWKGKTRPHPITWLSWTLAMAVITLVTFFNGGGAAVWSQTAITLIEIIIVILALRNGGKRDIKRGDMFCFAVSVLALICWLFAKQPELAMTLLLLPGIFGLIPTLRKTWHKPFEETVLTWAIQTFTAIFIILAVTRISYTTIVMPIGDIISNAAVVIIALYRRPIVTKLSRKESIR